MITDLVILFPDQSTTRTISSDGIVLKLINHPKYSPFLCCFYEGKLYELQSCSLQKYTTFFIDQRISSSSYLYLATNIDPRFILLPYFERSKDKFSPLEQIVPTDANLREIISRPAFQSQLDQICDVNTAFGEDLPFYRYNKDKMITWLRNKVSKLGKILQRQRLEKEERQNPSFVTSFNSGLNEAILSSKTCEDLCQDDVQAAVEIICDYLSESSTELLLQDYHLKLSDLNNKPALGKRKADWEVELEQEKNAALFQPTLANAKMDQSFVNSSNVKATPTTQNKSSSKKAVKLNEQAAKGTKSIHSFFTK